MSVIFCDTDCELWYTKANELGLKVINMPYTLDGKEYMCDLGEATDFKAFFNRMREGAVPITSGLNAEIYREIFEPYFEKGEDILYVAFSSKMSGTFRYLDAVVSDLSAKYPGVKFKRFDTLNISVGAGLLVYLAGKKFIENGGDVDATYSYLESILNKVGVYFVVDDLKYLARGGRLSPQKAAIGNIMQLKPILTVGESGEIEIAAKQQGSKRAMSFVVSEFEKKYSQYDDAPIVIVGADCDDLQNALYDKIKSLYPDADIWTQPVGPVIGAHCGPGTYGIIFPSKSR
ncbi:MAG: DegV family protein [Clostridia bacterium]|nr:DegV family protein [Clostridia bacterium]